jgi:hypothetical protein
MSEPSLLEYHLLSSAHLWFTLQALSDFHRPFPCAPRYGDYSQVFFSCSFSLVEDLLRYVLRGFRYPTFLPLTFAGFPVPSCRLKSPSLPIHRGDSNHFDYSMISRQFIPSLLARVFLPNQINPSFYRKSDQIGNSNSLLIIYNHPSSPFDRLELANQFP